MKNIKLITITTALILFVFASCEETDLPSNKTIEGIYMGVFTNIDVTKSGTFINTEENGIAEIMQISNETIQVHFSSVELDTTFMLNHYEDMDSIWVCFTGDDFENMYGHMLGQGHMNGGMMGDLQNNETEWMHHLNDEHQEGDEHFGGFDMQNDTFGYRFSRMEGGQPHYLQFQGKKE